MPLASSTAALIAAGLNLGGQIYRGYQSRKNVQETNRARRNLAEKAYMREKRDMEKRFQELKKYNTPAKQMERFREAGLNPNLIYSQGNPGNVDFQSTPTYNPPDISYMGREPYIQDAGSIVDTFQNVQMKQHQISQAEAEAVIKANEADLRYKLRASGVDFQKVKSEVNNLDMGTFKMMAERELTYKQISKVLSEKGLIELKKAYQEAENWYADRGVSVSSSSIFNVLAKWLLAGGDALYNSPLGKYRRSDSKRSFDARKELDKYRGW